MAEWPDPSVPRVLTVALALVLVVVVAQAANTSAAAFSVSNPGWEGSSELQSIASAEGANARVVARTAAYGSVTPEETVSFVLSPDSRYGSDEALDVANYVRQGGTLVVAAEGPGPANALLAGVGASARVGERPLYDVRENFRTSAFPVASNVSNHSLVADVESLTLNHATVVEPNGARVLVNTSEYAYLDRNRDGQYSQNESLEHRPVATIEEVGDGRVVVVSDASAFINSMLDRQGNRQLVRALAAGNATLLVDQSHTSGLALVPRTVLFLRHSGPLQFVVGTLAVGAVAVWVRRPDLPGSVDWPWRDGDGASADGGSTDDGGRADDGERADSERADGERGREILAASLAERYPDYDRETIERVASRLRDE